MSDSAPLTKGCTLVVESLFKEVNEQRRFLNQPPIEYSAMASRCSLRFQIDFKQALDFTQEKITISESQLTQLEQLINQQFGVYFDGRLPKLCEKKRKAAEAQVVRNNLLPEIEEEIPANEEPEGGGFVSKLKGLFGGNK